MKFLVLSLGGKAKISHTENSSEYIVHFNLSYNKNIKAFRDEEKQKDVWNIITNPNIEITDVEYIGEKEAQCIMVDYDDHMYLTEDFIVTHNTSFTTAIDAYAATCRCDANNHEGFKVLQIFLRMMM